MTNSWQDQAEKGQEPGQHLSPFHPTRPQLLSLHDFLTVH